MLISLNELKNLADIKISDDELFKLIGSRLVEIEGVEDLAPKYKKIYIVKVKSAEPIEGTHLHLCQIDAGKTLNAEIDPEHEDCIQVVCGAPNVHKGMLAVWIAPGAIVPSTYGTSEPFEISARPLRGFMSFGMLSAMDELDLGEDHAGIISVNPEFSWVTEDMQVKKVKPGDSFADVFDLNDKIIEVENKSLTHRPDCFGLIGFAREVAGVLGQKFSFDDSKYRESYDEALNGLRNAKESLTPLSVEIANYDICSRYEGYVVDFGGPVPVEWLPIQFDSETPSEKCLELDDVFFAKAGMRSISPIVDLTNKIMLMTGQPMHAFDYDKFVAVGGTDKPEIRVRLARKGEKLVLLDDKEIELNENDIVICSNDTPVALAGAMGGKSTAIDENTRRVIFEIASFSLYNLRKTQMAHGIFSEAITRFTKGRPASDLSLASSNLLYELFRFPDSKLVGCAIDTNPELTENDGFKKNIVKVTIDEINALLGSDYPEELIVKTLDNTGFDVKSKDGSLEIVAPLWRTDIHIKEDIIEEVGRLLGFDNLPLEYPLRPFVCPEVDRLLEIKTRFRNILSDRLGANEVLTYSFVSKSLQEKVNESPEDSYQIINSISPELECFRQSLVPSILDKIRENEKAGFSDFTLYELNQVTQKSFGLNDENVPEMQTHLGLTTFGDFYKAKYILSEISKKLGAKLELSPIEKSNYFEPLHSASIIASSKQIGTLGEIKSSVLKKFKLEKQISAIELTITEDVFDIHAKANSDKVGIKLSKFPSVSRDITFCVAETVPFASIEARIRESVANLENTTVDIKPVSIYQKPLSKTKNISFHLEITNEQKTLTSQEISVIIEEITKNLKTLGAEVV